jgi:hypothetical protein
VICGLVELDALNLEANLQTLSKRPKDGHGASYLVFQVIPPVWPCLFYTALFFDDRLTDYGSEYAKRHRDAVIIVAVNADSAFEFSYRFAVYLEAIVQLFSFDTELRCVRPGLEYEYKKQRNNIPS